MQLLLCIQCKNIHSARHTRLSSISYASSSSSFFLFFFIHATSDERHISHSAHNLTCVFVFLLVWIRVCVHVLNYSRIRGLDMLPDFWKQYIRTVERSNGAAYMRLDLRLYWILAIVNVFMADTTYTRMERNRSVRLRQPIEYSERLSISFCVYVSVSV